MTPQKRWVVLIELITIKVIEFQNFGEPGADRLDFLEGCCRDWNQSRIDVGKLSPPRLSFVSFFSNISAAVFNQFYNIVPVSSYFCFRPLTLDNLCYTFSNSAN